MRIGPTRPEDRIETLDLLRGFAVFGILIVNMTVFSGSAWRTEIFSGPLDALAYQAIELFAEGKFLNLFSFLFGAGFALQLDRAVQRGYQFTALYSRRLAVLLCIGLAHGLLIAWVDVLQAYALLGFLLLFLARIAQRRILVLAALCFLIPVVVNGILLPAIQVSPGPDPFGDWEVAHEFSSYPDLVALRLDFWQWIYRSPDWYADLLGTEFLLFLLGWYAGRIRFFERTGEYTTRMSAALPWLLLGGIALTVGGTFAPFGGDTIPVALSATLRDRVFLLGALAMSAAYASALVLLTTRTSWKRALRPLRLTGRMALTNYLMQSVICAAVFYHPGLGWYGKVGPGLGLLLTAAIFGTQLVVSTAWLGRARYGPIEWVWRSVTYRGGQPLWGSAATDARSD